MNLDIRESKHIYIPHKIGNQSLTLYSRNCPVWQKECVILMLRFNSILANHFHSSRPPKQSAPDKPLQFSGLIQQMQKDDIFLLLGFDTSCKLSPKGRQFAWILKAYFLRKIRNISKYHQLYFTQHGNRKECVDSFYISIWYGAICITKTCLFKCTENFTTEKMKISR